MVSYRKNVQEAQEIGNESDEQIQEPDHIREAQARAEIETDEEGQDDIENACTDEWEALIESLDNGPTHRQTGDADPDLKESLNSEQTQGKKDNSQEVSSSQMQSGDEPPSPKDLRDTLNKEREHEVEITPKTSTPFSWRQLKKPRRSQPGTRN